jgi:DNA-binding NarL/FixJ family response regulator
LNIIRVLIVDDHILVRTGIRALVERIDGIEVIAETGDGGEALRLIKELRPDIVLLEIAITGGSGFDVLEQTVKEFPDVLVIVLTVREAHEYAIRALRGGAAGYLPKSAQSPELKAAMETVRRGQIYLPAGISKSQLEYGKGTTGLDLPTKLSPRQRDVLALIAEGYTTKRIALDLGISVKTVETHRAQLMHRLNIHSVAGLVRYAIKMGL